MTDAEFDALSEVIPELKVMRDAVSTNPTYECFIVDVNADEYWTVHQKAQLGHAQLLRYQTTAAMDVLKKVGLV